MFKLSLLGGVLLNVVAIIFFLGGKYQVQTFKEDIILILILIILKMFLRNNIYKTKYTLFQSYRP